jgi:hypothetical protein
MSYYLDENATPEQEVMRREPTQPSDMVAELRELAAWTVTDRTRETCARAADEIERLRASNEAMRETLAALVWAADQTGGTTPAIERARALSHATKEK